MHWVTQNKLELPNDEARSTRETSTSAERIYDGYATHTLSMREYVLIHIIYSLHLYNEGIYTHIHRRHMSRTCNEPQVIA